MQLTKLQLDQLLLAVINGLKNGDFISYNEFLQRYDEMVKNMIPTTHTQLSTLDIYPHGKYEGYAKNVKEYFESNDFQSKSVDIIR